MTDGTYYLSSVDSVRFSAVRECRFYRLLTFDSGKIAVEARLSPGVVGQDFGEGLDIERVILTARHEGSSLDQITEFPCFVFIAIPRRGLLVLESPIRSDDLEIIGWGELYKTQDAAERHDFRV